MNKNQNNGGKQKKQAEQDKKRLMELDVEKTKALQHLGVALDQNIEAKIALDQTQDELNRVKSSFELKLDNSSKIMAQLIQEKQKLDQEKIKISQELLKIVKETISDESQIQFQSKEASMIQYVKQRAEELKNLQAINSAQIEKKKQIINKIKDKVQSQVLDLKKQFKQGFVDQMLMGKIVVPSLIRKELQNSEFSKKDISVKSYDLFKIIEQRQTNLKAKRELSKKELDDAFNISGILNENLSKSKSDVQELKQYIQSLRFNLEQLTDQRNDLEERYNGDVRQNSQVRIQENILDEREIDQQLKMKGLIKEEQNIIKESERIELSHKADVERINKEIKEVKRILEKDLDIFAFQQSIEGSKMRVLEDLDKQIQHLETEVEKKRHRELERERLKIERERRLIENANKEKQLAEEQAAAINAEQGVAKCSIY